MSVISIILMVVDHRQHHLESIRSAISLVIYPLQSLVNAPVAATHWAGENLSSRQTLLEENSKLRMQQTLLMARLQKLSSLKVENIRLRDLLKSSKKINENVLIGELLSVDLEPFTRQIVINKGSRENIYLGQPLIDAEGIMGQTVHVTPFSSTAMLITDPNHAIPVQVNRNGLRAIAVGNGTPDVLEIPYLANSADIVEGDLLTSSGLGGRFPPDYPVAVVNYVFKDASRSYAVVTATPTAKLETSREVLLVWTEQSVDDSAALKQDNTENKGKQPDSATADSETNTPATKPIEHPEQL